MDLRPSEMAIALTQSLDRFFTERYDFQERRRRLATAWKPDMWQALAQELGVLGAAVPEEYGGLGGGVGEVGAVMESMGRHLVVEPFTSTIVMGTGFLRNAKGDTARSLLDKIVSGAAVIAAAYAERDSGYDLSQVATQAKKSGGGYVLNGRKTIVIDAPFASHFIVTARTGGAVGELLGQSIFLVDARSDGIGRNDYRTIDGGRASDVILSDVTVPADALIGEDGNGFECIERVIDEATAAVCAEACGIMQSMLNQTVEYTRQRVQFGTPISNNQALQHRMVDMLVEMKQAQSLVNVSQLKMDTSDRAAAVSAAKSRIGRACRFVSQNAVQLHGAIGIADETAISHYFRRALMIEKQFGSIDYHLDRYERLQIKVPVTN